MDQGFSKANRLLKASEFERTLATGTKMVSPNIVLVANKNEAREPRLGLIVSRKVGNAVIRNRVKRQLRESFRVQKEDFAGLDVVIIARPSLSSQDSPGVKQELSKILERVLRRI